MIYENGEPWWNYIDRENSLFVCQSSLAIVLAKQEELVKEMTNFAL
jgi:hypothetical protein